jgi:hypothetical protein
MSKTLTTEAFVSHEWFTIEFESDSIERNRMMSVKYNGFLLDTDELPLTHPTYYKSMKEEMNKTAEAHWNSLRVANEVFGVPTLDRQIIPKNQMIAKSILTVIILLAAFTSHAQFLDLGGGVAKVTKDAKVPGCVVPVMKISAGYQFGNVVAEGILQPAITKETNAPAYLGAKLGYNLHGFIPSIGALYNYRNADDVSMNRWEVGYALKYQIRVNDNGGLFAEALYTNSSYSLTGGFNIQF